MQQDLTASVRRFAEAMMDDRRRNSEKLYRVFRRMAEPLFAAELDHIVWKQRELQSKLAAFGAEILRQHEEHNRKLIDSFRRRKLWT